MYSKEQASLLKKEFWTTFGQYMKPVYSAEGTRISWLNYKTGLKHVYFRMEADKMRASIAIEITHEDPGIQELFFEKFIELKGILRDALGEIWEWRLHVPDENGKVISRIFKELSAVNVFNESDWPKLISFFKPRIIALDNFWSDAKYSFESLK